MPEYNATGLAPNFANQKGGTAQPRQSCPFQDRHAGGLRWRAGSPSALGFGAKWFCSCVASRSCTVRFFSYPSWSWIRRSASSSRGGSRGEHPPARFSGLLTSRAWPARSHQKNTKLADAELQSHLTPSFSAEKFQLNTKRASSPRVYLPDLWTAKRAWEKQGIEAISQTAVRHRDICRRRWYFQRPSLVLPWH